MEHQTAPIVFHCPLPTQTQTKYLLDLPIEIITEIFGHIGDETCSMWNSTGEGDRAAISKTCRLFHQLIEPALYSCFVGGGDSDFVCLKRFLLTLLRRPELARHVRQILLGALQIEYWQHEDDSQVETEPLPPEEQEIFETAVRQAGFPDWSDDATAEFIGYMENQVHPYLALLLLRTTNLEELNFMASSDLSGIPSLQLVTEMAHQRQDPMGPLGKLKKLRTEYDDTENGFVLCGVQDLLFSPYLEEFEGLFVCGVEPDWVSECRNLHLEK
jgi:hypothetical protein